MSICIHCQSLSPHEISIIFGITDDTSLMNLLLCDASPALLLQSG